MDAWARTRNIEIRYPRLQGEAFFAAMLMSEIIKHLDKFYIRDYVLDLFGHAQGMALYLPYYSRVTLDTGQQYLNKGGYMLPVAEGKLDGTDAEWVLPWVVPFRRAVLCYLSQDLNRFLQYFNRSK